MAHAKKSKPNKRNNTVSATPARVPRTKAPATHLTLSLEENAYGFLNQSLRHYRKCSRNVQEWPFALLHLVQSLELLLKRVLQTVNPILIYKDIDDPNPEKQTVTLEQALGRLENLRIPIEEKERLIIRRAALKRNFVVHYKIELNKFEWKKIYSQLFEFLHFFHFKHLGTDIHSHVWRDNWTVEAQLMRFFRENFVIYNGVEVHKLHPRDILDAQHVVGFSDGQKDYYRIRYGDEQFMFTEKFAGQGIPCPDSAVRRGQYHTDGCDLEECPKCQGQALGCGCRIGFDFELTQTPTS